MKRSNAIHTLGMLLFVATYAASTESAHSGGFINGGANTDNGSASVRLGYVDSGTTWGNPMGNGFGYQGGLCGSSCAGSAFSSQYNGLPSRLPTQQIQHQVPVMPNIQGGWFSGNNGFPGNGFPGNGFPGNGFPGNGFPGNGFPGNQGNAGRFPCGFNPCGSNNFYPPNYPQLPPMNVPGGPCGGGCFNGGGNRGGYVQGGGGTTIIDMRSQAEWEKNDTASIIWGVSAGVSSMTSNVYPVAFGRQDLTIPNGIVYQGSRAPGFEPRSGLDLPGMHSGGGSVFQ